MRRSAAILDSMVAGRSISSPSRRPSPGTSKGPCPRASTTLGGAAARISQRRAAPSERSSGAGDHAGPGSRRRRVYFLRAAPVAPIVKSPWRPPRPSMQDKLEPPLQIMLAIVRTERRRGVPRADGVRLGRRRSPTVVQERGQYLISCANIARARTLPINRYITKCLRSQWKAAWPRPRSRRRSDPRRPVITSSIRSASDAPAATRPPGKPKDPRCSRPAAGRLSLSGDALHRFAAAWRGLRRPPTNCWASAFGLKALSPGLGPDASPRAVPRELRGAPGGHPNVCRLFICVSHGLRSHPPLMMSLDAPGSYLELLEGDTLHNASSVIVGPATSAADRAPGWLGALSALHPLGIVHVTSKSSTQLKRCARGGPTSAYAPLRCLAGAVITTSPTSGIPHYIAPEQVANMRRRPHLCQRHLRSGRPSSTKCHRRLALLRRQPLRDPLAACCMRAARPRRTPSGRLVRVGERRSCAASALAVGIAVAESFDLESVCCRPV